MGVCQSSICQCIEQDDLLLQGCDPKAKTRLTVCTKDPSCANKLKHDIISPTGTEATTPGSTLITPNNAPLSLTSVISMANAAFEADQSHAKPPTRFPFNTPDPLEEDLEEDETESLHEEGSNHGGSKNPTKWQAKGSAQRSLPEAMILNPPLLAPPPEQAEAIIKAKKPGLSNNDRMVVEFKKLQDKINLENQRKTKAKQEAKQNEREEEMDQLRKVWEEFESLKDCAELKQRPETTSAGTTSCASFCVNIRKDLKHQGYLNEENDDSKSCFSNLSLLSSASLDAQRELFTKKRQARIQRYAQMKIKERINNKITSEVQRRKISYFQDCIEETAESSPQTPALSPPRLEIKTNGKEAEIPQNVEDPVKEKKAPMTNMEVVVKPYERRDDACSAITDTDFDKDYWLHRRPRAAKAYQNRDDHSLGSSLISFGYDLPASITSVGDADETKQSLELIVGQQPTMRRKRMASSGVSEMTMKGSRENKSSSLGDRIALLEKKMGIDPPGKSINLDKPKQVEARNAIMDLQSPINQGAAFLNDDLEPTKLELMFDESTDLRERIVLRNSVRSSKSVAWMNKETFLKMATDDHAMVKVSRGLDVGGYGYMIEESNDDESFDDGAHLQDESCQEEGRDLSLAADVADEVGAVLEKYREQVIIDAYTLSDSFTEDHSNLYCA